MIWVVRGEIGARRDGPIYLVGAYRWKWRADLAVYWRRLRSPHRQFIASPVAESEWHPWRRGGRWIERRVLPPWFAGGEPVCERALAVTPGQARTVYVILDEDLQPGPDPAEAPARSTPLTP